MLFVSTNIVMYTKTIKKFDLASEFEEKNLISKNEICRKRIFAIFLKMVTFIKTAVKF